MNKKYCFYICLAAAIPVLLFAFSFFLKAPEGSTVLDRGWTVEYGGIKKNIDRLPFYITGDNDDSFITAVYKFECPFILEKTVAEPLIFVPFIGGHGIKVVLDNKYIGQAGDLERGNASIWNKAHVYSCPENLFPGAHKLEISIFGLYDAGIIKNPFLQGKKEGIFRRQVMFFYFQYLVEVVSGILILLSLFFIVTGLITREKSRVNIFMGLFLFSIFLYFLDYSNIDYMFIDYLVFKKISFTGISLAMIFLINLINRLFSLKHSIYDKLLIILNMGIIAAITIIPDNMIELRKIYTKTNLVVIFILLYIVFRIIKTKKETVQSNLFFVGLITVFCISAYDILQLFLQTGSIVYTHIGLAFFTIIVSAIAIYNNIEIHTLAALEKGKAEEYQKDAVTDSLTGIYNRRILNFMDSILRDLYTVIIIDMNSFKKINDTYGHHAGDMVLVKASDIIKNTTRDSDYILRYGGDEFLIVLPGCNKDMAEEFEKRLYREDSIFKITDEGREIQFSFSSGLYTAVKGEKIENAVKKADAELYKKKYFLKNSLTS